MCFGVVVCEFVATRAEKIADGGGVACRNPISLNSRDLPRMAALHAREGMFAQDRFLLFALANTEMTSSEPPQGQGFTAGSRGADGNPALVVLRLFVEAVGLPFNQTASEQALRTAEVNVPPTSPRAARRRLNMAAESAGLEIESRQHSISELLKSQDVETPLAIFAVAPDGAARWHVLTEIRDGRAFLARIPGSDAAGWVNPEQLAACIGVADRDALVEWLNPRVAAPLQHASKHGAELSEDDLHHGPPPWRRLLALLKPEMSDVRTVIIYALGVGVLSLAVPITAMAVVNTTALATLVQQLIVLCVALLAALSLAAFLRVLQAVVVEYLQQRIFVRVVADLSHRLPRVDIRAFDQQHGPELVNRFFDVLTVQKASATLLLDGVTVVLQVAVGLALLAFYHQVLLGFDLALIAGLAIIVFVLGRGATASSIRESIAKYAVAGWMEELARHPAAFKLSWGPQFAREQADHYTRQYLTARQSHFRIVLRQYMFALALQALASAALLGIGGYLVINGQLTLGQLVAAEIVVALVVSSFTKFGKQLESIYDLFAAVDKLGHLTDLPLEREGGVSHEQSAHGAEVQIRNLSFVYEGGHRAVLERLNLDIKPGERVALLGPNGAGKSTLVDLIFGLRQPSTGYIALDGVDLRDLRLDSLREHIAIVKGIQIFAGSILENVRMGRDYVPLSDIRYALKAVGLLEEIQDFPDGLATPLETGGAPLSFGQATRLMLARSIVCQPRLLVLDETLDDLDPSLRDKILDTVLGRKSPWTVLAISHNPEIARACDRQIHFSRLDNLTPASISSET